MTVGSLFAGIGGFDLAAERVWGAGCVRWQVEIDPFACRVLAKHWPNVPRFGDIRELTGDELEPVDLVCGGFPCQDISRQNVTGRGLDGERSGLWREAARLAGELRPRYLVVENGSDLLHRGLGRVLGDLAALGFDAEWHCIPAAYVGAPQIRDRCWIIAYPAGERVEGLLSGPIPRFAEFSWFQDVGGAAGLRKRPDLLAPRFCRTFNGVPDFVDRLTSIGNAIVPQVAEFIFRQIEEAVDPDTIFHPETHDPRANEPA
jgi:DNA (cytosine-5)-methyltransferase 1